MRIVLSRLSEEERWSRKERRTELRRAQLLHATHLVQDHRCRRPYALLPPRRRHHQLPLLLALPSLRMPIHDVRIQHALHQDRHDVPPPPPHRLEHL